MKLTLLLILMAITVGYCGKNKTDLSDWRNVFEQGEGSSRPSKLRRTSALTQQPANPRPVNPRPVNPRPVNPRPVNPRPVNRPPVNPPPVNPSPVNQYPGISDCECGRVNEAMQARIVGGKVTIPHRYPWAGYVHYLYKGTFSQYGLSILTNQHFLSASNVVEGVPLHLLFVSVGVHIVNNIFDPSQEFSVERVFTHSSFKIGNRQPNIPTNDIAIIITKEKINFAAEIGPVCLPVGDIELSGMRLKALGWGATLERGDSSALKELDVTVIPNAQCKSDFGTTIKYTEFCVMESNSGTCTGDEGGCLLYQNPLNGIFTQVGIISYNAPDCRSKPTVASNVKQFIKWISEVIVASKKNVTACYNT